MKEDPKTNESPSLRDCLAPSAATSPEGQPTRRQFLHGIGAAVATAALQAPAQAITTGSESAEDYDVIIIGSGISGAIVAKRLAEEGHRILILEAGEGHLNERTREVSNYFKDLAKFPEAPFDENVNAPSATIKDLIAINDPNNITAPKTSYLEHVREQNAAGKRVTTDFGSTYVRKTGGTMWHWMGTSLRFVPNDFRMKSVYERSVDWPINYTDLAITPRKGGLSYYDMAEDEIGVSASVEDQAKVLHNIKNDPALMRKTAKEDDAVLFRKGREYPMPPLKSTIVDNFFKKGVQGMKFDEMDVWVYPTPAGRNSVPRNGRPACAGNSSCVPICRIRAKYDATVTLEEVIRRFGKQVTLRHRCVVSKLLYSQDQKQITGVEYISYASGTKKPDQIVTSTISAPIYVLAANGIESPKLMLASHISNDNIGRNLMDHPFFLRSGLAPEKIYPYRGPLSTGGLDGLRDGSFRRSRSAYRIEIGNDGWALASGDPAKSVNQLVDQNIHGKALVDKLNDLFTRQCRIGFELEQLPDRDNRVTCSDEKDHFGIAKPRLRYSISDYEKLGLTSAIEFTRQLFDRLRITPNPDLKDEDDFTFMGAGHVMGTCCMGNDPKTSVVDKEQRSHDAKNLFVVGSSVFPTGGTANPSLTLAALAFWAADSIHKQLSPK